MGPSGAAVLLLFAAVCPAAHAWKPWKPTLPPRRALSALVRTHRNATSAEKEACPARVAVSGAETVQPAGMGVFTRTDLTPADASGNRSVYVNENHAAYMYYWAPSQRWLIGSSYKAAIAGVKSRRDSALCPTDSSAWLVWYGSQWSSAYPITVSTVRPTSTTTILSTTSASHPTTTTVSTTTVSTTTAPTTSTSRSTTTTTTTTATTTKVPYVCRFMFAYQVKIWPKAKRAWCCENQHIGCPPAPATRTTSTLTNTTTSLTTTTVTTELTTSTSTRTTNTSDGCDKVCHFAGKDQTCKAHIHHTAVHEFLGDPDSCPKARILTIERCPVCSQCSLKAAGCNVLGHLSTTVPSPVQACNNVCELNGQFAPCKSRIQWASRNMFQTKQQPCALAHKLVQSQCMSCGDCSMEAADCTDPAAAPAPKHVTKETFRKFDHGTNSPSEQGSIHARWVGVRSVAVFLTLGLVVSLGALTAGRRCSRRTARSMEGGSSSQEYAHELLVPTPAVPRG